MPAIERQHTNGCIPPASRLVHRPSPPSAPVENQRPTNANGSARHRVQAESRRLDWRAATCVRREHESPIRSAATNRRAQTHHRFSRWPTKLAAANRTDFRSRHAWKNRPADSITNRVTPVPAKQTHPSKLDSNRNRSGFDKTPNRRCSRHWFQSTMDPSANHQAFARARRHQTSFSHCDVGSVFQFRVRQLQNRG